MGQYAQESLTNLGLWDTVSAKASFGTNVTEVLNWVAESSADCGIVYATDAATTDKVKVVAEAPADSLESPVLYPVAMTKDAPNQEAARAFYDFIISDDAVSVFESMDLRIIAAPSSRRNRRWIFLRSGFRLRQRYVRL